LVELAKDKDAQATWFADLHLPRTTRYLTRHERGLLAFLERIDAAHPIKKAA